jgi:hypothetical protein
VCLWKNKVITVALQDSEEKGAAFEVVE